LILCAGILAGRLLLPGFIAMADNGDFGKVRELRGNWKPIRVSNLPAALGKPRAISAHMAEPRPPGTVLRREFRKR
jgi:hypothetical protein